VKSEKNLGLNSTRVSETLTFKLSSHNHIQTAKYLSFIRDAEWYKNLRDNTILACEIFSSGFRPRLKIARA